MCVATWIWSSATAGGSLQLATTVWKDIYTAHANYTCSCSDNATVSYATLALALAWYILFVLGIVCLCLIRLLQLHADTITFILFLLLRMRWEKVTTSHVPSMAWPHLSFTDEDEVLEIRRNFDSLVVGRGHSLTMIDDSQKPRHYPYSFRLGSQPRVKTLMILKCQTLQESMSILPVGVIHKSQNFFKIFLLHVGISK